jgi:hypothetical protein
LWCSYIKDGIEKIFYIKIEARNKTSEEYLQIAAFYPPENILLNVKIAFLDSSVGFVRDTRPVKYFPVSTASSLFSGG